MNLPQVLTMDNGKEIQWITVALTAGLYVSLSADAASAYARAESPAAQLGILRAAVAKGEMKPAHDLTEGALHTNDLLRHLQLAGPPRPEWSDGN